VQVPDEPLIYSSHDDFHPERGDEDNSLSDQEDVALDADRHPWLRGLDERALANLGVALTEFVCRPSFGSRTKREVELEVFAQLKRHRADWTNLGEIADDLAISRSRARSLVLDHYARQVGKEGRGARRRILAQHVKGWPMQQIEQQNQQLKIVIDDPFVRDLLKNFAYGRGILLDQSFAAEIQTFSWDSYARLLAELQSEGTTLSSGDFLTLTSDLRRQLRQAAARNAAAQVELDAQLQEIEKLAQKARKSKDEQRRELAVQMLKQYGPVLARIAGRAAGVPA
jgi:hypothetical protein